MAIGDVSANIQEDISGIRTAQAFNRTQANTERFRLRNAENRDANVSAVGVTSAFTPVMDILGTTATAIVALYGGWLTLKTPPLITVGVLVAFLTYVQQFFRPIQLVSTFYAQAQSALAAAERIFDLIDRRPTVVDVPGAPTLDEALALRSGGADGDAAGRYGPAAVAAGGNGAPGAGVVGPVAAGVRGRVTFDRVGFSYLPDQPVLADVSFEALPGQTVALVGATGAGKSTVTNLLLRFYDADEGSVLVDGVDVRTVTQASLRAHMGLVLQESFLFNGTIADNIRYGRIEATDDEVRAAARLVGAHGFIELTPEGLPARGGRAGQRSQPGAASADRPRPSGHPRSAHPDPGRGDGERRHAHRGRHTGRPRPTDARPHDRRGRPPALDHRPGRPDPGARPGAHRRAGHACRTARSWRGVLGVVRSAVRGIGVGRSFVETRLEGETTMLIQVLGSGCQKCNDLYENARAAAAQAPEAGHEVVKVDDVDTFFRLGVTRTPALAFDDEVVASGRVPDADEIAALIAARAAGE